MCVCHTNLSGKAIQCSLVIVLVLMHKGQSFLLSFSFMKITLTDFAWRSVEMVQLWFLQGVSGSCKPCTSYDRDVCPSVRPSVRPSVTRWHCVKTTQARIKKSSPTDSPKTLVFGIKNSSRNSIGVTPSEGIKWEWGRKNSQFSANNSPYLRNGASLDQSYY